MFFDHLNNIRKIGKYLVFPKSKFNCSDLSKLFNEGTQSAMEKYLSCLIEYLNARYKGGTLYVKGDEYIHGFHAKIIGFREEPASHMIQVGIEDNEEKIYWINWADQELFEIKDKA